MVKCFRQAGILLLVFSDDYGTFNFLDYINFSYKYVEY